MAWAYCICVGSSSLSIRASSASSSSRAASRKGAGLTPNSRSRTVPSDICPMNCRMTATVPLQTMDPSCGLMSPAIIRMSVVLPAPLAPTRAAVDPSGTRKETSSSRTRPSGRP